MCTKLNEFGDSTKLYHENIRNKLYTSILDLQPLRNESWTLLCIFNYQVWIIVHDPL